MGSKFVSKTDSPASLPQAKLRSLIRAVSRSFSLTLFALPGPQRDIVGLTYLVARVADTFADSGKWTPSLRMKQLESWESALMGLSPWNFRESVGTFQADEQHLLLSSPQIIQLWNQIPNSERHICQDLMKELIKGMKLLLQKSTEASVETPVTINLTAQDFDYYCYLHAGCVGAFWNRIFQLPQDLEHFAVGYGKALERINVLRDVVEDREAGRILLPADQLKQFGFQTSRPWLEPQWSRFCEHYVEDTKSLLQLAAHFCNALGTKHRRLRWASALPMKIGVASLKLYMGEEKKERLSKISRRQVRSILWRTSFETLLGLRMSNRIG